MRIINKKYLLVILLIGIITSTIIFKPKEDSKLYEVKLQDDNKKDLAIMVEQLDKSYKENNKIPYKGYNLNQEMTKCIDNNGNEVEKDITYENGTITISTDRTIYCYLYFDRKEEIEDLSGQGHNGKNHAVEWTEEGITTSNKDANGYVDCGLENYDFKDSITMITRVKFNDLTGNQQFFGNWENAGGGIIATEGRIRFSLYQQETSNYKILNTNYDVNIDKYYIIVGVYNGNEMSIYIDGEKISGQEISGNIKPASMPILLGANPNPGMKNNFYSYTTFTDALVFDSALTETEIKKYFSGEINEELVLSEYVNKYADKKSDQKLLLYYKFD